MSQEPMRRRQQPSHLHLHCQLPSLLAPSALRCRCRLASSLVASSALRRCRCQLPSAHAVWRALQAHHWLSLAVSSTLLVLFVTVSAILGVHLVPNATSSLCVAARHWANVLLAIDSDNAYPDRRRALMSIHATFATVSTYTSCRSFIGATSVTLTYARNAVLNRVDNRRRRPNRLSNPRRRIKPDRRKAW